MSADANKQTKQELDQQWSDYYNKGQDFPLITHQELDKILIHSSPHLPLTCLDIGCGTGQLTRELSHRGYRCVGADVSSGAIAIAKRLTLAKDALTYVQFDIENDDLIAGLPATTYSLITCKLTYSFIKNKTIFLQRVSKLLAKDGVFVIIAPTIQNANPLIHDLAIDVPHETSVLNILFNVTTYEENNLAYLICKHKEY